MNEEKLKKIDEGQEEQTPRRVGRPKTVEHRRIIDSYSIGPELLERLRKGAEEIKDMDGKPLGKSALIRQGILIILEKHGL